MVRKQLSESWYCRAMKTSFSFFALFLLAGVAAVASNSRLPDGTEFPSWEKAFQFSKTYYVDGQAKNADDRGPGSKERPFRTINAAARVLQPGERVVIAEGIYRECIRPARGGTSSDAMISYEAAPGAKVVVKGAAVVTEWKASEGWNFGFDPETHQPVKAWELRLDPALFPNGYNPFEVDNVIGNPPTFQTRAPMSAPTAIAPPMNATSATSVGRSATPSILVATAVSWVRPTTVRMSPRQIVVFGRIGIEVATAPRVILRRNTPRAPGSCATSASDFPSTSLLVT